MLNIEDLDHLSRLAAAATPIPWHVNRLDDDLCMGAVVISKTKESLQGRSMRAGDWPGEDVIAACLIQSPPYAVIEDNKFDENAELIAAMRNCLPDLVRLARIALLMEKS